jgi:heat-inducible transcriptional repressor
VLYTDKKLSPVIVKRLEGYFNWRLTGIDKPSLHPEEEVWGERLYKELMLRHIVNATHFSAEEIVQAGFSKLLSYADFNDAAALANGLALFENKNMLRQLLAIPCESGQMQCLIGEDLLPYASGASACSVIVVPYRINQTVCGAIGLLGPNRIPYRELFGQLHHAAHALSESLTKSVYKFKISFRNAPPSHLELPKHRNGVLHSSHALLLEDQTP